MKRPWQVWLVFIVCALGAAGAMAWVTKQAVDADRLRRAVEAEAEIEERVSLALWRMDTELAPIVAEEVIRPTESFRCATEAVEPPQYVVMQFEARKDGCESPQIPCDETNAPKLAELNKAVDFSTLVLTCPAMPLPATAQTIDPLATLAQQDQQANSNRFQFFEGNNLNRSLAEAVQQPAQIAAKPNPAAQSIDFEQRGKRYQTAAQQSLSNYEQRQVEANAAQQRAAQQERAVPKRPDELVGISRPVWMGDRLILARRVMVGDETRVQGCWLDWPRIKSRLLAEADELLPHADLVPVNNDAATEPSRMLAGLPVRLVVNESVAAGAVSPELHWALWLGWGAVILAATAAAVLLHGVLALSERRAAFVSSVTHELRTPLTTFRMYADMLARGMVPDAERRQEYFHTLQRESERLTLLVENVLSYARLERGRKPQGQDVVTLEKLLDRVGPRLKQRALQAEMQCDIHLDETAACDEFTTDQTVVEQILFNLVDNSAKYARNAEDRRIQVEGNRNGKCMRLIVRDHGPGIARNGRSGRAQPFTKSAEESAETAPGVGLGLALCQRLARQLGGRLEIAAAYGEGAAVTLLLPVS